MAQRYAYIPYIVYCSGEDAWGGEIYTDKAAAERRLLQVLWRSYSIFGPEFDRLSPNTAPPPADPEIHSEDCEDVDPGSTFEFMRDNIENYEHRRSQLIQHAAETHANTNRAYAEHFEKDVLALLTPARNVWSLIIDYVPYRDTIQETGVWKRELPAEGGN